MKNIFFAVTALLLIAGTITIISCNKDNSPFQKTNTTSVAMKGDVKFDQLREIITEFYTACDNAFANDPDVFISVCESNDETSFLEITGLKPDYISSYCDIANESLNAFTKDNPNFIPEEKSCETCYHTPLAVIGSLASATDGHLVELIPALFFDYDYYYMFDAITWYLDNNSDFLSVARINAHFGEYFQEVQSESMNTEMIVAKIEGEPEEGIDLPLTFNQNQFKNEYEKALKEQTGDNWAAEEVKAYMFFDKGNGNFFPVLQISAFNVDKETGCNMFMVSSTPYTGGNTFAINGRVVVTKKCVHDGDCTDKTCRLASDNGIFYCSKNCTGNCDIDTKIKNELFTACAIMFDLLY